MTTDQITRQDATVPAHYEKKTSFELAPGARTYAQQFNSLYSTRAGLLKSRVLKMCNAKWKSETINGTPVSYVNKILDVPNLTPCYTIGTVFVDMKYKPNILEDVSKNLYGAAAVATAAELKGLDALRAQAYADPAHDQIMLEDESGRMILDGELLDKIVLVTGAVVGVLGMEVEAGIFTVVDVAYPEAAPQIPRSLSEQKESSRLLLFLSGLSISQKTPIAPLELLKEFVMGEITGGGASGGAENLLTRIAGIVIAGNSIRCADEADQIVLEKDKYRELNKSNYDADSLRRLDELVADLLVSVPVTILPGESDPCEISLPKQPLHPSFFPHSGSFGNFTRATNPQWLDVDGVRVLGTSGENVNDMFKYLIPNIAIADSGTSSPIRREIAEESRLKLLEATLLWQNIVPTAPDTLCCYPYDEKDPFTLDETPHVYFVGNQPRFETSIVTLARKNEPDVDVRVVSVPDFSATGEAVLLDTFTLECTPLKVSC